MEITVLSSLLALILDFVLAVRSTSKTRKLGNLNSSQLGTKLSIQALEPNLLLYSLGTPTISLVSSSTPIKSVPPKEFANAQTSLASFFSNSGKLLVQG